MKDELDFYADKHMDDDDEDKSWLHDEDDDDWDWDDDDEYDFEDEDDLEVIVDSAEGLQVATTLDPEGNVVDVTVMSEDEIDHLEDDEKCPRTASSTIPC